MKLLKRISKVLSVRGPALLLAFLFIGSTVLSCSAAFANAGKSVPSSSGTMSAIYTSRSVGNTPASEFTITSGGRTYYGFCMEHKLLAPSVGTSLTISTYDNANAAKILYYGWDGPGQWSGFNGNKSIGVPCTAMALSYVYSGASSVSSVSDTTFRSFLTYALSQPDPRNNNISFSSSGTLNATSNGSRQVSPTWRLSCNNLNNKATIVVPSLNGTALTLFVTAPSGVTTSYTSGQTATVPAGSYLLLSCNSTTVGGTVTLTATSVETSNYAVYKATSSTANRQTSGLLIGSGTPSTAKLSVKFTAIEPNVDEVTVTPELLFYLILQKTDVSGSKPLEGTFLVTSSVGNSYTITTDGSSSIGIPFDSGTYGMRENIDLPSFTANYLTNPSLYSATQLAAFRQAGIYASKSEARDAAVAELKAYLQSCEDIVLCFTEIEAPAGYELCEPFTVTLKLSECSVDTTSIQEYTAGTYRITVDSGSSAAAMALDPGENSSALVYRSGTNIYVKEAVTPELVELGWTYRQDLWIYKQDNQGNYIGPAGFTVQLTDSDEAVHAYDNNPYVSPDYAADKALHSFDVNTDGSCVTYTYDVGYRWVYCSNWTKLTVDQQKNLIAEYERNDYAAFYTNYSNAYIAYMSDRNNSEFLKEHCTHTYVVTETKAPDHYVLDGAPVTVTLTGNVNSSGYTDTEKQDFSKSQGLTFINVPQYGWIELYKRSADTSITGGNSNYSYAGAEYTIYSSYSSSGVLSNAVGTMTTDASGYARSGDLPPGTYYVYETRASSNYHLDATVYPVTVTSGNTVRVGGANGYSLEPPNYGYIEVIKKSSSPDITDGNSCYSLEGGQFGVYTNAACTGDPVETLTTNADGYAKSGSLPIGDYWIRELKAPEGYILDDETKTPVTIPAGSNGRTVSVTRENEPAGDPIGITLTKIQETENGYLPSLAGAQFTINYYDGYYDTVADLPDAPTRTWVLETQGVSLGTLTTYICELKDKYKISGGALYYDNDGKVIIPLGTITVQETKAPEGYTTEGSYLISFGGSPAAETNDVLLRKVLLDDKLGGGSYLEGGNYYTKEDSFRYCSITLNKRDNSGASLAGAEFRLEIQNPDTGTWDALTTGVTDANGQAVFDNLVFGTYRITETASVDGYSLLAEPIVVELPVTTAADAGTNTPTYTEDGVNYFCDISFSVVNAAVNMPHAGGIGVVPFLMGGSAVLITAAICIICFKKSRKQDRAG